MFKIKGQHIENRADSLNSDLPSDIKCIQYTCPEVQCECKGGVKLPGNWILNFFKKFLICCMFSVDPHV